MTEPIYIAQINGAKRPEHWRKSHTTKARKAGARFFRITARQDLILFEAWYRKPDDQGDPRWYVTQRRSNKRRKKSLTAREKAELVAISAQRDRDGLQRWPTRYVAALFGVTTKTVKMIRFQHGIRFDGPYRQMKIGGACQSRTDEAALAA